MLPLYGLILAAAGTLVQASGPVEPTRIAAPPPGLSLPDRAVLAANSLLHLPLNITLKPNVTNFVVDGTLRPTAFASATGKSVATVLSHGFGSVHSTTATTLSSVTKSPTSSAIAHDARGNVPRADSYWLPNMDHGSHPDAPAGYTWFRNVADFGAKGDGVSDDTEAINNAIMQGNRCVLANNGCNTTSVLGAVVYFPPGNYLISAPLVLPFYTFIIGNPSTPPRIIGSSTFQGIALLDTDVYIPKENGEQYYANQNNFYRTIENFVLDLSGMNDAIGFNQLAPPGCSNVGAHYQVAQGTRMQNVEILLHQGGNDCGIFMENGSGGLITDVSIQFGAVGMIAGNQQFTFRNISFNNCLTGIQFIWDWVMTFQQISMNAVSIAFDFRGLSGTGPNAQPIVNVLVLDSTFTFVPIICFFPGNDPSAAMTQVYLENVNLVNTPGGGTFVAQLANGQAILGPMGDGVVTSWGRGKRYLNTTDTGSDTSFDSTGDILGSLNRPSALTAENGWWFSATKPTYADKSAGDFVSVKSFGAKGDGQSDDTQALTNAFSSAASGGQCVWIPMGIYVVTNTVVIPNGVACVVGEGLPQIMGRGSSFSDPTAPLQMIQVGELGGGLVPLPAKSSVQLLNLLFTVGGGNTGGAILVWWGVVGPAPGAAGMWDCYFRVGGAVGSGLQATDCPTGSVNSQCVAAATLLYVQPDAGGYFENVWAWTSDHDLDINAQTQVNVFSGRGIVFDRTDAANWCWACSAEHSVLAQFTVYGSSLVWLGHIQTETPYYQPSPEAPDPFDLTSDDGSRAIFLSDPTFGICGSDPGCLRAWALRIVNSTQVYVYGAGFYSFFEDYDQTCVNSGAENCQEALIDLSFSGEVFIFGLATIGSEQVVSPEGGGFIPQSDTQFFFTTVITAYLGLADADAALQGGEPSSPGGINSTVLPTSPNGASIVAIPGCTTGVSAASGQTFTLTAACATALLNVSIAGGANSGLFPGDVSGGMDVTSPCPAICDVLRLLTDTCCGEGGSIGPPVIIDVLPGFLFLPDAFVPNVPIEDTDGITHAAGVALGAALGASAFGGFVLIPPQLLAGPLLIPAGTLLGSPFDIIVGPFLGTAAGDDGDEDGMIPGVDSPAIATFIECDFDTFIDANGSAYLGLIYLDAAAMNSGQSPVSISSLGDGGGSSGGGGGGGGSGNSNQCPYGNPTSSDCANILDSMGNAKTPVPSSKSCFTGTTNDAQWSWCDYFTSGSCQVSLGFQTQFGSPFSKTLPSVNDVHTVASQIFANNADCGGSGSSDVTESDVGTLDFLVCVKEVGANCWVSVTEP